MVVLVVGYRFTSVLIGVNPRQNNFSKLKFALPRSPFTIDDSRFTRFRCSGGSMATYQLSVNGQNKEVTVDPSTPLLWVLREDLNMTGTKFGCGISACGACTVHVAGVATRSCVLP